MNEQQWNACQEPSALLEAIGEDVSERKLRLFVVACGRHILSKPGPRTLELLHLAEAFAEGNAARESLLSLYRSPTPPTKEYFDLGLGILVGYMLSEPYGVSAAAARSAVDGCSAGP